MTREIVTALVSVVRGRPAMIARILRYQICGALSLRFGRGMVFCCPLATIKTPGAIGATTKSEN